MCVRVCIYVCMHVCICMYVCMYVCIARVDQLATFANKLTILDF
jgi:hypothetical protein